MEARKFVIGIVGGSGVGKTTLINLLYNEFNSGITTLSLDNYYKPKQEQALDKNGIINFDLPEALNTNRLEEDFTKLINGQSIRQKVYNFNNPELKERYHTIDPQKIILVEGLFVLHYPFLKSSLDYAVYLSVDPVLQLERRLKRDVQERNYKKEDVIYQWENHVLPAYENYVKPYKSEADLVITNHKKFDQNIDQLVEVIKKNIY